MTAPREKTVRATFDADALYQYTWPGKEPVTVTGAELTAICKGADASLLNIQQVAVGSRLDVPTMSLQDTDKFVDGPVGWDEDTEAYWKPGRPR